LIPILINGTVGDTNIELAIKTKEKKTRGKKNKKKKRLMNEAKH
jgi:hypothetical protein